MYLKDKNNIDVIDTLAYFPIIPELINTTHATSGQTLNQWKVNNTLSYVTETDNTKKNISIFNEDGTEKSAEEIYEMLTTWEEETIFNAFFNGDLEAGNIKSGGETITKILIKRLSPLTNYRTYETIGEIPYNSKIKHYTFKDYFITSSQVYLYSIQPVSNANHYGAIQNRLGALNRYEYSWLIDTDGTQLEIPNSSINNISIVNKDGIIETIGGKGPHVNRFANLDYRSFTLTGTIASICDMENHITTEVEKQVYTEKEDIQQIINNKFIEKTGVSPYAINNSMRIDYNYERVYREEVTKFLKNGHKKIFKSPTEGLLIVKLTNISLTPKTNVNRIIYDFSATVTEVEDFGINSLKDFNLKEVVKIG